MILKEYLKEKKYELTDKKKLSFIYSLICIAEKIIKNALPYKMNTSNLKIIIKDNEEYLIDNFESDNNLERKKIDEKSILYDLSIISINILLGDNILEEKIIENTEFFIKQLKKELVEIEIKSFAIFPQLINSYLSKNGSLSKIQLIFKDEFPLNSQLKKEIYNLINKISDTEITENIEKIPEEKSKDDISSESSFSSYENYESDEEEKEDEENDIFEEDKKTLFNGDDMELKEIQKSIKEYYENEKNEDELNFFEQYKDFFEKKNFILTTAAKKRLILLKNFIELKINVLLEGPTGTAKTLSAEIICDLLEYIKKKEKKEKYKKKEVIKFNLSSETTIPDLLGRYIGSNKSLAGIKMEDGPFIDAYKNGKILILDEINLASKSVLECIEAALDNDFLSIDNPGKPLIEKIPKHKDFCLIATQNPNSGLYIGKRQDLGFEFLSHFQVIYFDKFTEEEYKCMAKGLSKQFGFEESDEQNKFIDEFVKFHLKWTERTENKVDELQCFTIREIAATLKALSNKDNKLKPYEIIMIIYGARYDEKGRNELSNVLDQYEYLKTDKSELIIPENFPEYFKNESIERVIRSILFSLENNRHVIITGKGGNGKTQLAKWFAQYWNKERQNKKDDYFCICTKNITCWDLIGRQKIIKDFQKKITHSILVKNINNKINKNKIKKFFDDCGEIESIKFSKDSMGNRKGTCYIMFKNEESISKALKKMVKN